MRRAARKRYTRCSRKIRYPTWSLAKAALRAMLAGAAAGDTTLKVYQCQYCKGFHLGHP